MKLICRVLGHQRSRRRIVFNNNARRWQSACMFCGAVMTRDEDSDEWQTPYV